MTTLLLTRIGGPGDGGRGSQFPALQDFRLSDLTSRGTPGRIHRWPAGQLERGWTGSSHGLGIPDALALGRALDRCPRRVVLFAVEAADLRPGSGLSRAVAASLPDVVAAIVTELRVAKVPPERSGRP